MTNTNTHGLTQAEYDEAQAIGSQIDNPSAPVDGREEASLKGAAGILVHVPFMSRPCRTEPPRSTENIQ